MSIAEALYSRLINYSDLTDLTGTNIFRLQAPEATPFPNVTFGKISNESVHAMGSDAGLEGPVFQVDVWAENTDSMDDVSEQIKAAYQGFSGTVAGVVIQRIFFDDELEIPDEDTNKVKIIYHNAMDFTVWYEV